jgi:WD40 repeat protein
MLVRFRAHGPDGAGTMTFARSLRIVASFVSIFVAPAFAFCQPAGQPRETAPADLPKGALVRLGDFRSALIGPEVGYRMGAAWPSQLCFSSDGKTIAALSTGEQNCIRFLDARTGELKSVCRTDFVVWIAPIAGTSRFRGVGYVSAAVIDSTNGKFAELPIEFPKTPDQPRVMNAELSRDGKRGAIGVYVDTLELWIANLSFDERTGKPDLRIIKKPDHDQGEFVYPQCLSPDGTRAAVGFAIEKDAAGNLKGRPRLEVLDAASGRLLFEIEPLHFSALAHDPNRYSTSGDEAIRLYDRHKTEPLLETKLADPKDNRRDWFPDENHWVVIAGKTLTIFDLRTLRPSATLELPERRGLRDIALSPDLRTCAYTFDGWRRLGIVSLDGKTAPVPSPPHFGEIRSIAIDPKSDRVVTTALDRKATIWKLSTGTPQATIRLDGVAAVSPDGSKLAVDMYSDNHDEAHLVTIDERGRKVGAAVAIEGFFAQFLPTGEPVLLVPSKDNQSSRLAAYSPSSGRPGRDWPDWDQIVSWDRPNRYSLVTPFACTVGSIGTFCWKPTPAEAADFERDEPEINERLFAAWQLNREKRPDDSVPGLQVPSRQRHLVLIVDKDYERLVMFDSRTGKPAWQWRPTVPIELSPHFVFSPDGSMLAAGDKAGRVHVWDACTGSKLAEHVGHLGSVTCLVWSADGDLLCSGSSDTTVVVWKSPRPAIVDGPTDLESHWNGLAAKDAAEALRHFLALSADPKRCLAFLATKLQPVRRSPAALSAEKFLSDLTGESAKSAREAERSILEAGEAGIVVVEDILRRDLAPDVRRHVGSILKRLRRVESEEHRRDLRGIDVLECLGSSALPTLDVVCGGAPTSCVTVAAKEAVDRLRRELVRR